MADTIARLLSTWDGEEVIIRFDRPTGAWIVIAIHSTQFGPAAGGTRMKPYADLKAAVDDAMRLAGSMTLKFAVTGLAQGGGKAVIALPGPLTQSQREDVLQRYGTLLAQLGGLFETGPDVGTSPTDMDIIARTGSPYVFCRTREAGGAGDSAPATAIGVFHGIRVTAEEIFGSDDLNGRTVLVQGAGSVGRRLIEHLRAAGASVLFTDVDEETVQRLAETGAHSIRAERTYDTPCDIFAPCALGGVLNDDTIPRLQCRAVAGAANNQLQSPRNAKQLQQRGIVYVPDFVLNLGGAMAITGIEALGWTPDEANARVVETVTGTVQRIFQRARQAGVSPLDAAREIAEERLHASAIGKN